VKYKVDVDKIDYLNFFRWSESDPSMLSCYGWQYFSDRDLGRMTTPTEMNLYHIIFADPVEEIKVEKYIAFDEIDEVVEADPNAFYFSAKTITRRFPGCERVIVDKPTVYGVSRHLVTPVED